MLRQVRVFSSAGLLILSFFCLFGFVSCGSANTVYVCPDGSQQDTPCPTPTPVTNGTTSPVTGSTQPPVNPTHTSGGVCRAEKDYPLSDTLSGLSSGFYRIQFYIGNGPENESWLPAGPGVSYKVNANVNGHVWEFPSTSCTVQDMKNDAQASHRRRSTQTTVSSSPYVDPSDPLVTSNFIKQ